MNNNKQKLPPQPEGDKVSTLGTEGLLRYLQCDANSLSAQDAKARLEFYGPNTIREKRKSPLLKFLSFFWGPIAWMIEAAVLSAVVHNTEDLTIILVLLVFNAVVGFWQEYQAGNAIDQLKTQLALKSRVRRDGDWIEIDAGHLVPGDIVRIRLGDVVPADIVLIVGDSLSIDQSSLTGESLPVDKRAGDLIYSGSIAKQGEMTGVVTAIGTHTYFGKTAKLVSSAKFVARTRHFFLSRPFPAPLLLSAIVGTQLVAMLIAVTGWYVTPISWQYVGLIWSYCLVWVLIEDSLKLLVYRHLEQSLYGQRQFLKGFGRSLHFHSNAHVGLAIAPANERYCAGGGGQRSINFLEIQS